MPEFLKSNLGAIGDMAIFAMAGLIIGGFMWVEQWDTAKTLSNTLFGAAIMRFRRR